MSALDILSNVQSDYGLCVEIDDAFSNSDKLYFVNRSDFGFSENNSDSSDQQNGNHAVLTGSLVLTESDGQPFGAPVRDVLASINLINTESDPRTELFGLDLRGKRYRVYIYGETFVGLGNPDYSEVTAYDEKELLLSGYVNNATYSTNSYLLSLGSAWQSLDVPLLDEITTDDGVYQSSDFDFTTLTSTSVQSNATLGVTCTDNAGDVDITFTTAPQKMELSISTVASGDEFTSFVFEQVNSTTLRSTTGGITVDITVDDFVDTTRLVTFTFSQPVTDFEMVARQIYGNVTGYSNTPTSVTPAFPNTVVGGQAQNSVVVWDNLPNVTTLSFTVEGATAGGVIVPDEHGRAYITAFKLWPTKIVTSENLPDNISFSISEDSAYPAITDTSFRGESVYKWDALNSTTLTLSADFTGTIVYTPDDNSVIIGNDDAKLKLSFKYIEINTDGLDAKIAKPVIVGNPKNIPLKALGNREHFTASRVTSISEVRDSGTAITLRATQAELDVDEAASVKSYRVIVDAFGKSTKIKTSFDGGTLTADVSDGGNSDFADLLVEFIDEKTGFKYDAVDSDSNILNQRVDVYIGDQITVNEYISKLFADCNLIADSKPMTLAQQSTLLASSGNTYQAYMVVTERNEPIFENYQQTIKSGDIQSDLNVSDILDKYYDHTVNYDLNYTIQSGLAQYRAVGRTQIDSDSAIQSETGSKKRVLSVPFPDATYPQKLAQARSSEALERKQLSFSVAGSQWALKRNVETKLETDLLADGSLFIETITEKTAKNKTDDKISIIKGTYYVKP